MYNEDVDVGNMTRHVLDLETGKILDYVTYSQTKHGIDFGHPDNILI